MNQERPTFEGFLRFIRDSVGVPESAISDDSPTLKTVYDAALEWTNIYGYCQILISIPVTYRALVYNLGASFLINYANDEPGSEFFKELRKKLGIGNMVSGFTNSAADQGTSGSKQILDRLQGLDLAGLMLMQDPYGRVALAILMQFGSLWGLS